MVTCSEATAWARVPCPALMASTTARCWAWPIPSHSLPWAIDAGVRTTAVAAATGSRVINSMARRHAFEMAAHGDRVIDLAGRDATHHVAAGWRRLDEAFLFQRGEGDLDRSARRTHSLGERDFGQAFAGLEFAFQDHVAQLDQNA